MADRFAELLAKGKAGTLTAAEKKELARHLSAPVTEQFQGQDEGDAPAASASGRRMVETDVAARLRAIDWFAHCGEPREFGLSMAVARVESWSAAIKSCASQRWEDTELEASNQLRMALFQRDPALLQGWNEKVDQYKEELLKPLEEQVWVPFQTSHGLDIAFIHSLQWDILAALMANDYLHADHGIYFFLELLSVYEAGHFPCGWRGKWPVGELLVY